MIELSMRRGLAPLLEPRVKRADNALVTAYIAASL